jgi:hypothetical protein
LAQLPAELKRLEPFSYTVEIGAELRRLANQLDLRDRDVANGSP